MRTFYFTYGTSGQPFRGGWTKVIAEDIDAAVAAFREKHPDKTAGLINCSSVYPEEYFDKTDMGKFGNLGAREHEIIYA